MPFHKGHRTWNKGLTKETDARVTLLSIKNIGKSPTIETREKLRQVNIGKKQSFETIEKRRLKLTGLKRSNDFKINARNKKLGNKNHRYGIKQSEETKIKRGLYNSGHKSSHWKGGITPLHMRVRHCREYILWRTDIFKRDNFTCQECGKMGGDLNAHHIKKFSILLGEALKYLPLLDPYEAAMQYTPLWDKSNVKTLCVPCHNKTKKLLEKI